MLPSRAKFKRFLIAASVMLVSMMAIWWAVWMISAAQYRVFIDNWIESHKAQGYAISYDSREIEGFPRYVTMHFGNFVLVNSDGIRIHAPDVLLAAFPWQWRTFNSKFKHGFDITIPFYNEKTLTIGTPDVARNHTELDEHGDWQFVNLGLENAKATWGDAPFFGAGKFEIAMQRPETPPKDQTQYGLIIDSKAEQLTLPPDMKGPFGPRVDTIKTTIRVMGKVPDPRRRESVSAWTADFGVAEFDTFFLKWGPLIFSAKGTLGLDDDLQPEGVFSSQIGNHEAVIQTLLRENYIPQRQAGMVNSALNLFAKHSMIGEKAAIDVPISVQLGGLFLGPVRIFEFPEIKWEGEQPAASPPSASPQPAAAPPSPAQ